jgi:uncharacterized damage-inducible protein DinB
MTQQSPALTLAPFYRGWEDYQRLLIAALAPLTPEQLALHDGAAQRPVWLLAAHIIGTRIGWFRRMGEGRADLDPLDRWDDDAAPPRTAAELIDGLERSWSLIAACLDRWTPADLDTPFTYQRPDGPMTRTRQWIIWHLIEHDLHHGGELSLTLGNHGLTAPDL